MSGHRVLAISEKELKLTAALYAKLRGVLDAVRETGALPPDMKPQAYYVIPMKLLMAERGTDIELDPNEQLVYDAIVRAGRTPAGAVQLLEDRDERGRLVAPVAAAMMRRAIEDGDREDARG